MLAEDRPGDGLSVVGEEKPVRIAAGEVDRRVAPGLSCLWRRLGASLKECLTWWRHAPVVGGALTALPHELESRQVFAALQHLFSRCQQHLGLEISQSFQPESFYLVQLGGIRVRRIKLIMVVQPE